MDDDSDSDMWEEVEVRENEIPPLPPPPKDYSGYYITPYDDSFDPKTEFNPRWMQENAVNFGNSNWWMLSYVELFQLWNNEVKSTIIDPVTQIDTNIPITPLDPNIFTRILSPEAKFETKRIDLGGITQIGKGNFGNVYQLDYYPQFVVKISKSKIHSESDLSGLVRHSHISPKVYDAWFDPSTKHYYIIMERFEITLKNFIEALLECYRRLLDTNSSNCDDHKNILCEIFTKIMNIIDGRNIEDTHGDIKESNIGINYTNTFEVLIFDWGKEGGEGDYDFYQKIQRGKRLCSSNLSHHDILEILQTEFSEMY